MRNFALGCQRRYQRHSADDGIRYSLGSLILILLLQTQSTA